MNVQGLDEKVDRIIRMLKCVPDWEERYFNPVLEIYEGDALVDILWDLFREGGTLCMVINADKKNAPVEPAPLDLNQEFPFTNTACKKNVFAFLGFCANLKKHSDNLFTLAELYSDDEEPFSRAISLVQELLLETDIDFQDAFVPTDVDRKQSEQTDASKAESDQERSLRSRVIDEILETEKSYVKDLKVLQDYKKAVQSHPDHPLQESSVTSIFCNLDDLIAAQVKFLDEMSKELSKSSSEQSLGSFFLESIVDANAFKEYSKFCSNYPSALEHVSEISDQLSVFDDLVKESQIHWYLIKPIQRICKYPLLLRELLKNTEEDDPEHETVTEALAAVKKVTDNVNEEHRKGENIIIAKDLVKRMVGNPGFTVESFGKLLLVEPLTVVIQSSEQEAIVYLFENYLLFCKEMTKVDPETKKKVTEIHLKASIDTKQLVSSSNVTKDKDFRLKCLWQEGLDVQMLYLRFKNLENLMRWLKTLIVLITDIKEHRKSTKPAQISLKPTEHLKPIEEGVVVGDASGQSRSKASIKAHDILLGRKSSASKKKRPKDVFDWMDDVVEEDDKSGKADDADAALHFDNEFAEDAEADRNDRRPTLFDKATSFLKGKKTSSEVVTSMPQFEDGQLNEKAEKMLLGKSSSTTSPKKLRKDIFAWMDEEIESAADLGEETSDSFLHKHFVTSSMLADDSSKFDFTTKAKSSGPKSGDGAKGSQQSRSSIASVSSATGNMITFAKVRYNDHTWLIRFPQFSTLKPYTIAIREATAAKMKENANHWPDLMPFSDSFEPLNLMANRLRLYYVDSEKNFVLINSEEDFWLCLSDCGQNFSMSFAVRV